MYKRKKLKNKKLRRGGTTGFEGSPELGGQGTRTSQSYGGNGSNDQTSQTLRDIKKPSADTVQTSVMNLVGKSIFDVTGAGTLLSGAKKVGTKLQQIATPKLEKQTAKARLSGSPIYDYRKPTVPTITTTDGGNGDNLTNILKKPLKPVTTEVASFRPKDFFPFQAYKSGGVPSGPPPLKGPNSQIPPVKMRKGKMTKSYKFSCPSRPDGIRGMGAAIKGHKFTGVK